MKSIEQVKDFWDKNLCGSHFINDEYLSQDFYKKYNEFRYKKAHHLNLIIDWESAYNKKLLEIGLGIGADGTRWAQNGADYTGMDLTDQAVKATRKHFDILGLKGNIQKGNAEHMGFESNTFDIVYSHGVLHHTANMQKSFDEVYRVLKNNGTFIVMLYAKESFNYWIRIQLYFRVRLLISIFFNKFNIKQNSLWELHISNFKEMGWSYLSWSEFPHHCTDGPECTIANIYSLKEIEKMLFHSGFMINKVRKAHFPIGGKYSSLERFLGSLLGFHRFIWAVK